MDINLEVLKLPDLTAEEFKALPLADKEKRLAEADRLDTETSIVQSHALDEHAKAQKKTLETKAFLDKVKNLRKTLQSHIAIIKTMMRTERSVG